MKIPLVDIKNHLEKNSSATGKVVTNSLSFVKNHPWLTLGTVAAGSTLLSMANKVHPLHQIYREETKNTILKDQNKILLDILRTNKNQGPKKNLNQDKILIQPLS